MMAGEDSSQRKNAKQLNSFLFHHGQNSYVRQPVTRYNRRVIFMYRSWDKKTKWENMAVVLSIFCLVVFKSILERKGGA